jgi:hypothetical protein
MPSSAASEEYWKKSSGLWKRLPQKVEEVEKVF